MTPKKTLQEREKELRSLLATPTGREEIQELASRYYVASGKVKQNVFRVPVDKSTLVNRFSTSQL